MYAFHVADGLNGHAETARLTVVPVQFMELRDILQRLNYLATDPLEPHRTATNRVITIP
jgi:hypothetical protein